MKSIFQDNEHIVQYLDYYLTIYNSPGFAVLIKGDWGSGKTWFINQYIKHKKEKGKKFLSVSLYGIKDFKEIEESFFKQLHPVLASKGMKLAGQIIKGLIKTTISIDLDKNGSEDFKLNSDLKDINIPGYFDNVDSRIIILDDLERCSMEIPTILGYINQLVEVLGLKVIILANEEEILKLQNGDLNRNKYRLIKEKLIGKTFEVKSNFQLSFQSFLTEVKGHGLIECLKQNREIIAQVYRQSRYENLRLVKYSIHDFGRFYFLIPPSAFEKTGCIEDIIAYFFAMSFEFKKGNLDEKGFLRLFSADLNLLEDSNEIEDLDKKIKSTREKYSVFNTFHIAVIDSHTLLPFLKDGINNENNIKEKIQNSHFYIKENTPICIKLYYFTRIETDKDFKEVYEKCFKDFKNLNIKDVYILTHLTGIFLNLNKLGFNSITTKDEILKIAIKNLDTVQDKIFKIENKEEHFSDGSYGYAYQGNEILEFKNFKEVRNSILQGVRSQILSKEIKGLLEEMEKTPEEFVKKVTFISSGENLYYNSPILKELQVNDFIQSYLKLKTWDKVRINEMFVNRYKIFDFNKDLIIELEWLRLLKEGFIKLSKSTKGNFALSKYIIDGGMLINLNKAIQILEGITS